MLYFLTKDNVLLDEVNIIKAANIIDDLKLNSDKEIENYALNNCKNIKKRVLHPLIKSV